MPRPQANSHSAEWPMIRSDNESSPGQSLFESAVCTIQGWCLSRPPFARLSAKIPTLPETSRFFNEEVPCDLQT